MKKKNLFLAAALALSSAAAHADEGMWTLYNLPQAVYEQMKSYGFTPSYDQLYKSEDAIKNAVVNFSGYCSGVVVSPDGLVFTNHHCGFEAIRSLALYRGARLHAQRLLCEDLRGGAA